MVVKKSSLILLLVGFMFIGFVSANHVYTYSDSSYSHEAYVFTQGDTVYGKGFSAYYGYLKMEYHYTNDNSTVLKSCITPGMETIMTCDWINAPAGTWVLNLYFNDSNTWQKIADTTFTVNPVSNPFCGNGNIEIGEECDNGTLNGIAPWTPYGASNTYCSSSCKIKTINGGFCGDGIKQSCELCDDGNLINNDGCSDKCIIEKPKCNADIAIKYSYSDTFNSGIGFSENGVWLQELNLSKYGNHTTKYRIDNLRNDSVTAHIVVKLDSDVIMEYDKEINSYTYRNMDLDISNLTCGVYHTIFLDISAVNATECSMNDNHSSRPIFVRCEENPPVVVPVCGDGIVNQANETCDGSDYRGNTCSSFGYDKGSLSCSSSCVINTSLCENNVVENEKKSSHGLLTTLGFNECVPNWECSGWSECYNGVMTRTCTDSNKCSYEYNRPIETSKCTMDKVLIEGEAPAKNFNWLFVTGVLVFILLLLVLINLRK